MLGTLPVPGCPTNLDYSRARAYCACNRCGWGVVWTFFLSSITSLFFLLVSGRRQGCKIPLARSHWRVNIGGGRVKLAVRSPDWVSAFPSSEFVILQQLAGKTAKRRPDFSEVYTRSGDHFLVYKYYP